MKPPPFEYYAPHSLEEALGLLAEHGSNAKILAGGQSLIPAMNFRMTAPSILIDLNPVPGLDYIRASRNGALRIGAMTRQSQVEKDALVRQLAPLVHETIPHIAHPQIRNRGTFGGSLAHADPAAELPVIARALDARLKAQTASGSRWIEAVDFFQFMFTTDLAPDEILVEVEMPPMPPDTGWSFLEFSRRHGDYALVGVAALVTLGSDGRCQSARLVFLNVGDGPVVAAEAATMLSGQELTEEAIAAAARHASQSEMSPIADVHASAGYQRHLAQVLAVRALKQAAQRATRSQEAS